MKRDKRNGGEMVEKKRKGDDKRKNVEKKVWSYSNRICMEMGYDHQVFLPTIQNIHILPFYSFFFSFTRPRCVEPCHIPEDALLDIL